MSDPNAPGIPATTVDSLIGLQIDGCTIQRKIGQGGMGIVYLAEHPQLRQQYVVKVLNPALTAAEDTIQRFFREAQSVARLNHPSIVSIQNVGQQGDYYYIRMEYVDGDTVENLVKQEKKLDWKAATKIACDTAEALSHAHKKGIIHRDIKPENIMFTKNGMVKVMDFGLAKQVQAATKVSITGQIVGTPFFMSPEQAGGKTTDARSDIYSLGVTYYYLLTGVKPFNGKNLQEIFLKHFFYTPESPKIYTPELPEDVCEVIRRCLKKKKKERYQSAAQLARDLRIILGEEPGALSSPSVFEKERDDEPSASSPDFPAKAAFPSDPAMAPAGAEATQRSVLTPEQQEAADLAAAQAEIGAAEEASSTLRVTDKGDGGAPPADGGAAAPPVEPEAPTGPLHRRGGRVALDQVAAASLVFTKGQQPSAAPAAETAEPGAPLHRRNRVALDQVAGASMVFSGKKPAPQEAQAPSEAGVDTMQEPAQEEQDDIAVTPTAVAEAAAVDEKQAPPAKGSKVGAIVAVVIVVVIVLAVGIFQMSARSRLKKLQARFAELEKAPRPASTDGVGWAKVVADYTALNGDLSSGFGGTLAASDAKALADRCEQLAIEAEDARKKAQGGDGPIVDPNVRVQREKETKQFEDAIEEINRLEAATDWGRAAAKAMELDPLGRKLGPQYAERVQISVHVISTPGGAKVFDVTEHGGDQAVLLGETPKAPGTPLWFHARANKKLKLEIRKPRFKTETWEQTVDDYVKFGRALPREVRHQFELGETSPLRIFNNPAVREKLRVASPLVIDTQQFYFIGHDAKMRSLDKSTGRSRWNDAIPIGEYGDPLPGPDVLRGLGAIVTVAPDGWVRAHEAQQGSVVWSMNVGSPIKVGARIDAGLGTVVVGTQDGEVVLLDAARGGAVIWRKQTDAAIVTRPQIQGDRVYAASRDDKLRVFDKKDGTLVAVYDAQEEICIGPILQGSTVYLGTKIGRVHALAVSDPTKALFTTAPVGSPIVDLVPLRETVYYATANDVRAVAAGAAGGNAVFSPQRPELKANASVVGIAPMHDTFAVVTSTGRIEARNPKTGELAWSHQITDKQGGAVSVIVPPVADGEDLYVVTKDGEVFVLAAD